jgi:hypothetical protein
MCLLLQKLFISYRELQKQPLNSAAFNRLFLQFTVVKLLLKSRLSFQRVFQPSFGNAPAYQFARFSIGDRSRLGTLTRVLLSVASLPATSSLRDEAPKHHR